MNAQVPINRETADWKSSVVDWVSLVRFTLYVRQVSEKIPISGNDGADGIGGDHPVSGEPERRTVSAQRFS